jgi:hypothetical protein
MLGYLCAFPGAAIARRPAPARSVAPVDNIAAGIHAFYAGRWDDSLLWASRKALSLDYVSAFSFDIPWNVIEPLEGKYDWHLIDQALAEAAATHKKISFGLSVAWWSPEWVKQQAASFTFRHWIVGERRSPVPWDPYYVQKLKQTISTLGRRYNGNSNIAFIVISGPATFWGTETNWAMMRNSISPDDLRTLDFSLEKYRTTWEDMIDTYFRAFPNTALALALNDQIVIPDAKSQYTQADVERAVQDIRNYALAKQRTLKPGQKMWLELLGLSRGGDRHYSGPYTGSESVSPYEALVWDVRDSVHVLYQDGEFVRAHNYTPFDFASTMQIGLSFGADAIEVYTGDLFKLNGDIYEPYLSSVQQAHSAMIKKAQDQTPHGTQYR